MTFPKYFILGCMGVSISAQSVSHALSQTDNPFSESNFYLDPDYKSSVDNFFSKNKDYLEKAKKLKLVDERGDWQISTAVWLDNKGKIYNNKDNDGHGIRWNLEQAYEQAVKHKGTPTVITFVVYDLPNRDCDAYSSNGEIKITPNDINAENALNEYKTTYIDEINKEIDSFYTNSRFPHSRDLVRVALVIEPDSVPNMITNSTSTNACSVVAQNKVYEKGIAYALETFGKDDSISMYLDIAHSGWLGWETNLNKFSEFYNNKDPNVAGQHGLGSGFDKLRGFITNTSNYTPTSEGFSYDLYSNMMNGIINADFYQWNDAYSEDVFIAGIMSIDSNGKSSIINHKFLSPSTSLYENMHFLIDTSRNGWNYIYDQTVIPLQIGKSSTRFDARNHRGNWCNIESITLPSGAIVGAGLGDLPTANPVLANPANLKNTLPIDAYVWIKPPGESDGFYDPITQTGDQMCGEGTGGSHNQNQLTNAMQDILDGQTVPAPRAGKFFDRAFKAMIDNTLRGKVAN